MIRSPLSGQSILLMKCRTAVLAVTAAVLLAGCSEASRPAAEATGTETPLASVIDSVAEAALANGPVPAISVAVLRGTDTIAMRGYGYADLENDVPASAETVYRIGSITKQFTAAAILRLAEEGKLDLQDPLTEFFPDAPASWRGVTVHQLLNHTSGIKSYTSLGPKWVAKWPLDLPHDSLLALFRDEAPDFEPGEKWLYNNSGYYLLGMIIEQVTEQPYAEYLESAFFDPLELSSTTYCSERPLIEHRAEGYDIVEGEAVNTLPMSMTQPFAAGALCSSVGDLVRWERALEEGQVVSADSYGRMITATTTAGGEEQPYGYGLFMGELDGHAKIAHGGGINGFISYASHYPDDDLTIAVLTNSGSGNPEAIEKRIARRVLGLAEPVVKDVALSAAERTATSAATRPRRRRWTWSWTARSCAWALR